MSTRGVGVENGRKCFKNDNREFVLDYQSVYNLVWVLLRKSPVADIISCWTGYHIMLLQRTNITKSYILSSDCSDAPATKMSTIYHLMERALLIRE